jgi:protein-tyrosine-phosphatase
LVFATIQINRELERIGDYAESIARQALAVSAFDSQPPSAKFIELGDLSAHMLRDAMQAFVRPDADLAQRTMPIEERANALRNSINADLAEMAREGRLPAAAVTPWMTVARRLERASDQAKNMCEEVLYMCTGEFSKHKGADLFRILFLDMANNCLSQMAEGIANSLGLSRFVFASAGLAPQPVDRRTVEFMASKGLDISRQTSKSLDQIPQWEHHQVIVTLGSHVQEAIPAHPAKMIFFNWPIQDPSTVQGPAETVQAAFESARQALESNLKELVGAISDGPQAEIKS